MPLSEQHDFGELLETAKGLIVRDKSIRSMPDLADRLGVNYTTLVSGFRRHFKITNFQQLLKFSAGAEKVIEGEEGERIEVEFDGNFGEVRALDVRGQIRTVDELLKAAKVDRAQWEPFQPEVRKWDVIVKLKDGDEDEIQVVPSFFVASKLRAKNFKPFEPVIKPVSITSPPAPPLKGRGAKTKKGIRRALLIFDAQVGFRRRLNTGELTPFHDRRVLDLALQVAESEEIDHIALGGDCLDLSEWSSKFTPEPEFYWTTQPALIELAWWLAQLRAAKPNAKMKKLEGNHDKRMMDMIVANLRQAYRLKPVDELTLPPSLSVPRLLALHKLNIDYVDGYPDNGYWMNKNIFIAHGDVVRSAPGATALEVTRRQAFTTIFGHIHRRELVSRRMKTQEGDLIYSAFCPGCACHIDGRVPGSKSSDQWQQGIAVIEYTEDAENIIPIAIQDGEMMYNGRLWKARDREKEIEDVLTKGMAG